MSIFGDLPTSDYYYLGSATCAACPTWSPSSTPRPTRYANKKERPMTDVKLAKAAAEALGVTL